MPLIRIGRTAVRAERAASIPSLTLGLMFRRWLAPDAGLLLEFGRPADWGLHTWFVRFPLDLIFIRANGRVAAIRTVRPWSGPFRCGAPVNRVLEVNAGWCRRHGIRIGSRLQAGRKSG